jgi:hypothetical protein
VWIISFHKAIVLKQLIVAALSIANENLIAVWSFGSGSKTVGIAKKFIGDIGRSTNGFVIGHVNDGYVMPVSETVKE